MDTAHRDEGPPEFGVQPPELPESSTDGPIFGVDLPVFTPDATNVLPPEKKGFHPATYTKVFLGLGIALNVAANCIGVEYWTPETAGAMIAVVVLMPGIFLALSYGVWWISGRRNTAGNIALLLFAAFYLLSGLGTYSQRTVEFPPKSDSNLSSPAPQQNPSRRRE